ncbi:MAG: DEAD/DEAH box helicase, partial [Planctomyces sp.]
MRLKLPVDDILNEVTQTLQSHNCLTLVAPPGSGKTTRVPSAVLLAVNGGSHSSGDRKAVDGGKRKTQVIMLEPRRIAARTAARRIAEELGESVGRRAGYAVRFEQCLSDETEILVVTEGILLRRLQMDPFLEDVGAVIFDEFHERRLDSDLAISMVRRIQQTVREDLRIVVMSATLEAAEFTAFLGQCPLIRAEGRCYPVEIEWRPYRETSGSQRNSNDIAVVE